MTSRNALKPKRLILNFFMAFMQSISVKEMIEACALFGIKETTVRVTLARLSAEGLIQACGRGQYELSHQASELASGISKWRTVEQRLKAWDGHWLAVHCAGLGRSDRAALRLRERALAMNGFRELEKDLFIRPNNLNETGNALRQRLYSQGLEAEAPVFEISSLDDERDQRARRLWSGEALTEMYRDTRLRLEEWLSRHKELDIEEAARESFVIGDAAIRKLVFDPLLPDELVDSLERHKFIESVLQFDQAGQAIWLSLYKQVRNDSASNGEETRAH